MNLEYNTLIPGPARHPLPVEVFEQGDGVLPRDSGQFFEGRHVNSVALGFFVSGELLFQLSKRLAVKDQLW